nr:reverse transcriptase domain-containing protein [Tanacetum cinerariifolium]
MRTRSSSNIPVKSPPNPSTSNPKCRNRRRSKQPFILEESLIDTMADQRTPAELLRAPTEGYAEAILVPSILAEQFELKHSLINMMTLDQFFELEKENSHDHIRAARRWLEKEPSHSILTWEDFVSKFINEFFPPSRTTNLRNEISNFQQRFDESFHEAWNRYKDLLHACPHHDFTKFRQLDTFYNALNLADQDSFNSAAGGNLMERRTQDVLIIIESKSKVRNSRNKLFVSQVKSGDANSNSSSEIAKLTHAVNQQTSAVTTAITAILKQFQATPPPASVKAVEEICVTCGGAHPYYQSLAAGGNTFPKLRDNIQGYVAAAAINFNQGNSSYRPSGVANQIRPPGFAHRMSGSLPRNTIANPKGELKAITTRSGIILDGPFVPISPPFINPEENERVEETLTDQDLAEYTIKVPPPLVQKSKPHSQRNFVVHQRNPLHPNILYPSRMYKQKQQEKDEKMLKALISNKEKLLELANTPRNENCSVVILKKLHEKLGDPGKFLISCGFSELKCKALADLGASINLMPLYVWKKLGLPELISNHMTLELANRAICTLVGIARDVFVSVGKFTFPADFVIVDYESDSRIALILGRHFLWTARALIDVHEEKMSLHDNDERLTLNMRHDTSSYSNQPQKESINLINVFNDLSEDFLENLFSTNQPSGNPTFSSHPILTSPEVKYDIFDPEGGNVLPEKLLDLDSTKDLHPPHHKIKESKILINELDLPSDFLPPFKYDSFLSKDFFEVDALPSTNNEDKVFNLGILIQENLFEVITRVAPEKNEKKLAISHASLILENFDPPLYELPFFKEVLGAETSFLFSFENEEKVFKPGILTSKEVHSSLIPELSHQGCKVFKINQILKSLMKIFLFSHGKNIHILDVPCLYFYPP